MTNELKTIITEHLKKYPKLEFCDILKLLYQNEFGPKHIAENELESFRSLSQEFKKIEFCENAELFEDIGCNTLRLNLKAIPKTTSLNCINKIIINSAEEFCGTNEKLVVKFGLLVVMAENKEIPFDIQQARDETNAFARNGFKPISHSDIYKACYSPAYRVISKKYKPLVEAIIALNNLDTSQRYIVISIDGKAGAGKTSLCNELATLIDAEIVHCDDFFLPPELRTDKRLKEIGGNIHYERLKAEVIDKLKTPKVVSYKAFDCKSGKLSKNRFLMNKKFVIVEGSYSSHPYFENYADLKIFLDCDDDIQKLRLLKRNGPELTKRFIDEWIPKENQYFEKFKIAENSDIVIRSV